MAKVRINKALADAGIASRRKAEELVLKGKVTVNGCIVTDLATRVDPSRDDIKVTGKRVRKPQQVYYVYYKPRGMVSTMEDEKGRECLGDVCKELAGSPRPVGRLDRASEGLMLLTNDGETTNRLTHPRYQVRREYQVTVRPVLKDQDAQALVSGVELDDGMARCLGIELTGQEPDRSRLVLLLEMGRNRIIRRMFEHLGYEVRRLRRVRLGTLVLGSLKPGESRQLSAVEVANLRAHLSK